MKISIIVAKASNNAIGKDNDLLWHLPADMFYFKKTTIGHCIVTGRKNYESIPPKFRPLVDRTNIVVTRDTSWKDEGAIVKHSLEEAIQYAKNQGEEELFIIGGGQIYQQSILTADTLYITEVDVSYPDADTFFPEIDSSQWQEASRRTRPKDEKNPYDMDFVIYKKKGA